MQYHIVTSTPVTTILLCAMLFQDNRLPAPLGTPIAHPTRFTSYIAKLELRHGLLISLFAIHYLFSTSGDVSPQ